jgi:hypothetical protein
MNVLDQLDVMYQEIDKQYKTAEDDAHNKGHWKKKAACIRKRELNDMAYFLFIFTRLEGKIRDVSDALIDNKLATLKDWKARRAWEILQKQKQSDSLQFMNRVSLVAPKGGAVFNLIKHYYDQRNNLGHGGKFNLPMLIPTAVADMKRLFKSIKK